jgi:2'-5' RNA ligase
MPDVGPEILYLDCYLDLDLETLAAARELNRRLLAATPSRIDFAAGTVPHVTLYMGLFPVAAKEAVVTAVTLIADQTPPVELDFQGVTVSREGYVFWRVRSTPWLQVLHENLLLKLSPLRGGLIRDSFLEALDSYDPFEQQNIRNYGFPWVLAHFQPHLTLGVVDPGEGARATAALGDPRGKALIREVGLGPVGDCGAVLTPGRRFPLKG